MLCYEWVICGSLGKVWQRGDLSQRPLGFLILDQTGWGGFSKIQSSTAESRRFTARKSSSARDIDLGLKASASSGCFSERRILARS